MKKIYKVFILIIVSIIFNIQPTYASNKLPNKKFNVDVSNYNVESYIEGNKYYLFLPQEVDTSNLTINTEKDIESIDNGTLDKENNTITGDFSANNEITVLDKKGLEYKVIILKSNLPSMYISLNGISLETINNGSKEIKYENNKVQLSSSNSKHNFEDSKVQIKGRGNFNWDMPKKPYQIKLSSKTNVLGMGKSKTWLLIANYGDVSLMRNKLIYDLAKDMEMEYAQNSEWIDLWIDGEYQGNYLITEKVQLGSNRVDLPDTENALIVELDNNYYASEDYSFKSNISNTHFVLKDSEAEDEGKNSFSKFKNFINNFEKELYKEEKDWDKISSMIDVESFVKFYFIQELTENADGARSSVYMYKNNDEDILHMGPVWDFDLGLGNCTHSNWEGNPTYDYITNIKKYMGDSNDWYSELFKIPEFREEVIRIYNDEIKNKISESIQKIDNHTDTLTASINMNFIKWKLLGQTSAYGKDKGGYYKGTYIEEVEDLKTWSNERINYLNERYSPNSSIVKVRYKTHIQGYGWKVYYSEDGELSGTTGKALRLEGIKIELDTNNSDIKNNLNIEYQTHIQDYGWQDYVSNGKMSGTTGKAKRLEAINIRLTGEIAEHYDVYYRVHAENFGWLGWARNGEDSGTAGYAYRLEGIEIKLVPKGEEYPEYGQKAAFKDKNAINSISLNKTNTTLEVGDEENLTATIKPTNAASKTVTWTSDNESVATVENGKVTAVSEGTAKITVTTKNGKSATCNVTVTPAVAGIEYRTHIQNIGWQAYKKNGEMAGTTGKIFRLEAINIKLRNAPYEGGVEYRTHVQNIGWQNYVADDAMSGTSGKSLRLEAIQIKLTGELAEHYDIYYRVHAENFGWLGWAKNSESSGTAGYGFRLEGIEIVLVDKGGQPPVRTDTLTKQSFKEKNK